MIAVKYPSGRIATICHDCCNDKQIMLPKTNSGTSTTIKDLNTRISVLEKMLEERPYISSKHTSINSNSIYSSIILEDATNDKPTI